jgi:hypothetical protein
MVADAIGHAIRGGMEVSVGDMDCVTVLCNIKILQIACPSLWSALGSACLKRFISLLFEAYPCPAPSTVTGTLKGYDQLLNLVLDEAIEKLRGEPTRLLLLSWSVLLFAAYSKLPWSADRVQPKTQSMFASTYQ